MMIAKHYTVVKVLALVAMMNAPCWAGGFVDMMDYGSEAEFLNVYTKYKDVNTGDGDWDAVFDGDKFIVDEFSNVDVAWWNHIYARRNIGETTGDIKVLMHFTWDSDAPTADRGRLGVELLTAPGTGVNVDADWPDDHVADVGVWNDAGFMAMSTVIEEVQRQGSIDRSDGFPFAPFTSAAVPAQGSATAIIERIGDQLTVTFDEDSGSFSQTATRTDAQAYSFVGIVVEDFNGYPGSYDGNPVFTVDMLAVLTGKVLGAVTETAGSTDIEEGGATDTYEIVLNTQPTGDVELAVAPVFNGANVKLNGGDPNAPVYFTITPATWDQPRTVTVEAVDDDVVELDHLAVLSHTYSSTADPNMNGVADYVFVNIADNDVGVRVVQTDGTTEVTEGGATDTYSVVLKASPAVGETVTISAQADGEALLSAGGSEPAAQVDLVFDDGNWNVEQVVTVSAIDDSVLDYDQSATITHTCVSGDPLYDGLAVVAVVATVHDNECGAWGFNTLDLNRDCVVDLRDLSLFQNSWLSCTMPFVSGCIEPGGPALFYIEGASMTGYYAGYGTSHMGEDNVALLYGNNSGYNTATATFTLTELPMRGMYIYIRGHNDDVTWTATETSLTLNQQELQRTTNAFQPDMSWGTIAVAVPSSLLRIGTNELSFSVTSGGVLGGPPWALIDWVAVGPLGYEPTP